MKDRADRDHLVVAVDGLYVPNLRCEQPRSHGVIKEIGLGELLRLFDHLRDQRRVRHADTRFQTCQRRDHWGLHSMSTT